MDRQPQIDIPFSGHPVVFVVARNSTVVENTPLCHRSEAENFHVIFALANALEHVWNRKVCKSHVFSEQVFLIYFLKICG